MPFETTVRTRRPAAAVMALQSAKGTVVNDLRMSSGAVRVWTRTFKLPAGRTKNNPKWMQEKFSDNTNDRVTLRDDVEGELYAAATPENLTAILACNWGPMSGTPATSTLSSAVNKYATLAWIESTATGSAQNLVQLADVWIHRVKLLYRRDEGILLIRAQFAGRNITTTPLNSLGGILLTAAPVTPNDVRVYNVRNATFKRDPTGLNVSLDFIDLDVVIDQQVNSEWTFSDKWDVRKRGKTMVYVHFITRLTDEYWAILTNSVTGTKERFQINATSDGSPSSTLTMDLFNLDWHFEPIGHDESAGCLVEATGRAFLTAQPPETGFVAFTIT